MTKEEWNKVKDAWPSPVQIIEFECDGYKIALHPFIYKMRLVRAVYVNGFIKGCWLNDQCEEGRRFIRRKESFLFKPKQRKDALKRLGKKMYNKLDYDKKIVTFYPIWSSFAAFKRHLTANNKDIKLIK